MSAADHVEMQLAAGADEVVLTAAEAYELLSLIDGIPPEVLRALLASSSLDHRTSIYHSTNELRTT